MNFTWPSLNSGDYESCRWYDSQMSPGVRFAIRRISLAQRIELVRGVRELSLKNEFLQSGDSVEQLEASLTDLLVRKLYVEWGLAKITGLNIDGEVADAELLISKGPELLVNEIVDTVQAELGLSDAERKNF